MSNNGAGISHCVHGKLNADKYRRLLEEWLPQTRENFPDGIIKFQQDNHPAHIKDWFGRRHDVEVIEWPARSPDLNSIENMWAALKWHIRLNWPSHQFLHFGTLSTIPGLHCKKLATLRKFNRVHAASISCCHRITWRL